MKNTGKCPKCGGDYIVDAVDSPMYRSSVSIRTGITMRSAVWVHRYVCCSCGYLEQWVDREDIPQIQQKYLRHFHFDDEA